MRGTLLAIGLLAALVAAPTLAGASADATAPAPDRQCSGLVDTLCTDAASQPNGTICLLAIGGTCVAWL